jgi:hypothetical protein
MTDVNRTGREASPTDLIPQRRTSTNNIHQRGERTRMTRKVNNGNVIRQRGRATRP